MRFAVRIAVLTLFLSAPLLAQESVVDKIVTEAREHSQVMNHLDYLVNTIGPRLTGSNRCDQACLWAKAQFERWGLKAELDEWGTIPVGFNRGPWTAKMLAPEELDLVCTTAAWSPGTNGPTSGPAVLCPEDEAAVEKRGDALKGAWVILAKRVPEPVLAACEKRGAHGFIRRSATDLLQGDGRHLITWDRLPTRVTIVLVKSQHTLIVDHLKGGHEVRLTFDIKNEFKKGPVPCANVVADLRGTEKPDEVVIVGGHIDSWDGATGTTDNGTGVATTLEAARILSAVGAKPKRTIRFMLWTGEEQGLLGSESYVRRHPDLMKNVSAVFVHDMGTNYLAGLGAPEDIKPILADVFAPVASLDEEKPFQVRKVLAFSDHASSDHGPFLAAGVPAFFWDQKGRANYYQTWHTQHDTYGAAIPEYQRHSAIVVSVGALGVANLDALLPRATVPSPRSPGRRQLGVQCEDDLLLSFVVEGSAAEKAGLCEGDQILKIGERRVTTLEELREAIRESKKETTVTIQRDDKELVRPVTFPEQ
ncbi:MAG: M20/M25/M40 family metallo-hydrolase [Planctomycetes bacterium]|nr:M20/M25/M40 family metallo-hydrolase [Planctomycetota bacterium]